MITYSKYNQHIQEEFNKGKSTEKTITVLEAKLRFKEKVAPADRENILDRFYGKEMMFAEHPLDDYLEKTEKIIYNSLKGKYRDGDLTKKRKITVKKRRFKLGLDIKVISNEELKPKEMLDLEALDTFIFTGKYPKE